MSILIGLTAKSRIRKGVSLGVDVRSFQPPDVTIRQTDSVTVEGSQASQGFTLRDRDCHTIRAAS